MLFDPNTGLFYLKDNIQLNFTKTAAHGEWIPVTSMPEQLVELIPVEAIKKLQDSKNRIKLPIGVIGTNKPTEEQYQVAEQIGTLLAELGLVVICGGRQGIMEAVCKGIEKGNGISIGLLPELNLENANSFVTIPIATGVGFARNSIIAASAFCLIAIGGSYGTLSEIAYGLQFGKKVFAIHCNLKVDNLKHCQTVDAVIENIYKTIFNIAEENVAL